ncbi:sugar phosphate isomerase/epimerase family protein [Nocardia beijingensis]
MKRVLVQPRLSRLEDYLALAKRESLHFELIEFSHANLTWPELLEMRDRYSAAFAENRRQIVTFHGAFMDLTVTSPDLYVAEASRRRVNEGVQLASSFDVEYILFHSNIIPSVATYEGYEETWIAQNIEFWSGVVEQTTSTVLIENMFDPSPAAISAVIDGVGSDRLRACLNVGHANVFSKVPMQEWFETLGDKLVYFHFSDNDGTWDASFPPGTGTVDWHALSELAAASPSQPDVLMGIAHRGISAVEESLAFLRGRRLYPFNS